MLDYILGLLGLGGVGVGIAAWFVGLPALLGIINSLLSIVSPFFRGLSELVVWYIKEFWEGAKIILSNSSTFVVILTFTVFAGIYGSTLVKCETFTTKTHQEKIEPTKGFSWEDIFGGR